MIKWFIGLITGPKTAISIFVLALSAGGVAITMLNFYLSERDSKVEAEILAEQNAEAAESVANTFKNYALDMEEQAIQHQKEQDRLKSEFNDAKGVVDSLSKKLAEQDLVKQAQENPNELERRANTAYQQLFDAFEKASGNNRNTK